MFLLLPIRNYHPITNQFTEVVASLVPLDFQSIASIEEGEDKGTTKVNYKIGKPIVIALSFGEIISYFNAIKLVDVTYLKQAAAVSSEVARVSKL